MVLTIYFDGKEVVVSEPSERLIRMATSPSKSQSHLNLSAGDDQDAGQNCDSILVSPSRVTGKTIDMWIKRDTISAVRLAESTSRGNG
ncbi:MAG: hypothetical protein GWN93_06140 [Deltaproteobacteria bacterium]|nr:hypothetical protein [Deltaproteobacteria bacterium]